MQKFPMFRDEQPQDKRPLPELIASGGNDWNAFPLSYNDVDGVRYYAVQDWIAGITQTGQPRKSLDRLKKRYPELSPSWRQLPYKASNGRIYQMDHADADGLYKIAQRLDTDSSIRDRILAYLAASGVKMDEFRIDPSKAVEAGYSGMRSGGMSADKAKARVEGVVARSEYTMTAKVTHVTNSPNFAALTTQEYKILFGRAKSAIVAELGLTKAQADNHFRDHLDTLALQAIGVIESTTAKKMQQMERLLTDAEQQQIIVDVAHMVAPSFQAIAGYVGIDLATGKSLLKEQN